MDIFTRIVWILWLWIYVVKGQDENLQPLNCYYSTISDGTCSSSSAPYVFNDNYGTDYIYDGFCIIHNTDYENTTKSYFFESSLCSYGYYAGGIFFNFQDEHNYDTFYTSSDNSNYCTVGYVESDYVYESASFYCHDNAVYIGWLRYEVLSANGTTIVGMTEDYDEVSRTFSFTAHFPSTPNAGPLHMNNDAYNSRMYFLDSNLTIIEDSGPDTPDTEVTEPLYQIRLEGDFQSSTGSDFSTSCMTSYSYDMNVKTSQIARIVDSAIGSSLCTALSSSDILVPSSSGLLTFDGSQGTARPSFYLDFAEHLLLSEIESCVTEITDFLIPHSNWGEYVVAPVPGCPEMDFSSTTFTDLTDIWVCIDSSSKDGNISQEIGSPAIVPPQYGLGHTGYYFTENGDDLSIDCQGAYSSELFESTNVMINGINNPDGAHMCGHVNVDISISSAFLSGSEDRGITLQDYIMELSGDMTFTDVYICADRVLDYLAPHSNWMDPIIPQFPGCPKLIFRPERFEERVQQWVCAGQLNVKDFVKDTDKNILNGGVKSDPQFGKQKSLDNLRQKQKMKRKSASKHMVAKFKQYLGLN